MDDSTILGSVLGQLGQTAKKAGQQIVKLPEEMGKDLGGQIAGSQNEKTQVEDPNKKEWQSDEERIKFLKDLYGTSPAKQDSLEKKPDAKQTTSANSLVSSGQEKKLSEFQEQIADKSPEEQKTLMELRSQLHKENYYDPTFNPVRKQEERPAEKVEQEKKKEMMELQQKEEKKPPPIAVQREQNKAEMFRGAAG